MPSSVAGRSTASWAPCRKARSSSSSIAWCRRPAAGRVGEPRATPGANRKDFRARLDLALAYWAGDQRKEAIDELLAMIKLDRNWNEAAARQQLLKFFEALGFTDPLAVDGRKRLSTILFSWAAATRSIPPSSSCPGTCPTFRCPTRFCCPAASCRSA